jgi:hypothetical protein
MDGTYGVCFGGAASRRSMPRFVLVEAFRISEALAATGMINEFILSYVILSRCRGVEETLQWKQPRQIKPILLIRKYYSSKGAILALDWGVLPRARHDIVLD